MTAVLIVALVVLVLSPLAGLFLYAGSLWLAMRWFRIPRPRFRSILWLGARIAFADLVLSMILHAAGLDSAWWALLGVCAIFAVFLTLVRRYQPAGAWRALGVFLSAGGLGILGAILVILVIVVPVRAFVASPFAMRGESMLPALRPDDLVLVDKLTLRSREPQRGDAVVLIPPGPPGQYYVKRVVGLPEEQVRIRGGDVTIFNREHPDGFTLSEPYLFKGTRTEAPTAAPVSIPAGSYFVLGDNREHSSDSRYFGVVPRQNIVGIVARRIWPPA